MLRDVHLSRPADAAGSLVVVGTGFLVAGQTTPEALACIRQAERLLFLVAEPATRRWLETQHPRAESLQDAFWEGRHRPDAYEEVVERILAPVRAGERVCVAFYGHPGVFVHPSHEAIRRAREEGFAAQMLPGVSAEDCLFAELEVDPALRGCQSFEATDFLVRHRRADPGAALILWQIGALGVTTYSTKPLWNSGGLALLVEELRRTYPATHPVVVYEASLYPVCDSLIQRVPLAEIERTRVSTYSTLYVPPAHQVPLDGETVARLGLSVDPGGADAGPPAAPALAAAELPAARPDAPALVLVGTGDRVAGHVTPESLATMRRAERLLYLVTDPATGAWLREVHPGAESLHDSYVEGEDGRHAAARMVERIVSPLREGRTVCAAFYGHPGVLVHVSRLALARARGEGFPARMLPAVSIEDCLFADLGLDPAVPGRALFDATDFLLRPRQVDPAAALVLLQAGAVGLQRFHGRRDPDRRGLALLAERLLRDHAPDHPVVLYEASLLPPFEPSVRRLRLDELAAAPASVVSTLVVMPRPKPALDGELLGRLRALAVGPSERALPAAVSSRGATAVPAGAAGPAAR